MACTGTVFININIFLKARSIASHQHCMNTLSYLGIRKKRKTKYEKVTKLIKVGPFKHLAIQKTNRIIFFVTNKFLFLSNQELF